MKFVAYILTMPKNNAWNGKWTGDDKLYARVRKIDERSKLPKPDLDLVGQSFTYDFPDGWQAQVEVKEVSASEAKQLKLKSVGFAGYDWMVASLLKNGHIEYESNWQRPFYY